MMVNIWLRVKHCSNTMPNKTLHYTVPILFGMLTDIILQKKTLQYLYEAINCRSHHQLIQKKKKDQLYKLIKGRCISNHYNSKLKYRIAMS